MWVLEIKPPQAVYFFLCADGCLCLGQMHSNIQLVLVLTKTKIVFTFFYVETNRRDRR